MDADSRHANDPAGSGGPNEARAGRGAVYAEPETPTAGSSNGHHSPAHAFSEAAARFAEVKEYASYLLAAKLDGIKATVRNIGIYAALGVVGLIVGGGILVTAGVLLMIGLAGAISALFNGPPWLGQLIVGVLILGGLAGGVIFGLKYLTRTFKTQLVAKYEERQRQQRSNFGHDVEDRSAQQRADARSGR